MQKNSAGWHDISNLQGRKESERKAESQHHREGFPFGLDERMQYFTSTGRGSCVCGYLRNSRINDSENPTEIRGLCQFLKSERNVGGAYGLCSSDLPMNPECIVKEAYFRYAGIKTVKFEKMDESDRGKVYFNWDNKIISLDAYLDPNKGNKISSLDVLGIVGDYGIEDGKIVESLIPIPENSKKKIKKSIKKRENLFTEEMRGLKILEKEVNAFRGDGKRGERVHISI